MNGILNFFKNALKAIVFSPFYLVVFALTLIYTLINYVFGLFKWIFSGFKYATDKGNMYLNELEEYNERKAREANHGTN